MGIINSKLIHYIKNHHHNHHNHNNNNNNNSSSNAIQSLLQKLPNILVIKIISYLDTIDKICFSFTCRQIFQLRKRFFKNLNHIKITTIPLSVTRYVISESPGEYKGITKTVDYTENLQQINNEPIRKLIFSSHFYHLLHPGDIPETCKKIKFQCTQYIYKISSSIFPKNLESLEISFPLSELGPDSLPCNLKKLTFTNQGVCNIENKSSTSSTSISSTSSTSLLSNIQPSPFPNSLKSLSLGLFFNSTITPNLLPTNLTYLDLGSSFDSILEIDCIPRSVKKLVFSYHYTLKHPVSQGIIPNSVTSLSITYHGLHIYIPESVIELTLECQKIVPIGLIPGTVDRLTLCGKYYFTKGSIPPYLKSLAIDYENFPNHLLQYIPKTVTDLSFGWLYNVKLDCKQLPPYLTKLSFNEYFDNPLENLPPSLQHLKIGKDYCEFSHPLPHFSPALTRMSIGSNYRQSPLPPLKQLSLRGFFLSNRDAIDIVLHSTPPTNIKLSKSVRIRVTDSENCIIYTKSTVQFVKLRQLEIFQNIQQLIINFLNKYI